jgi:hypothetical protein
MGHLSATGTKVIPAIGNVHRQDIGQSLFQIVKHPAAHPNPGDERRKVVIQKHKIRRFPRHVGPAFAHGDPDVGGFERGGIVDAVPVMTTISPLALRALERGVVFVPAPRGRKYLFYRRWRAKSGFR